MNTKRAPNRGRTALLSVLGLALTVALALGIVWIIEKGVNGWVVGIVLAVLFAGLSGFSSATQRFYDIDPDSEQRSELGKIKVTFWFGSPVWRKVSGQVPIDETAENASDDVRQ